MKILDWKQNNLKHLMKVKNLSQKEMAEELGVAQNTISQYVNAKREPSVKLMCEMCNFLKLNSIYELFK